MFLHSGWRLNQQSQIAVTYSTRLLFTVKYTFTNEPYLIIKGYNWLEQIRQAPYKSDCNRLDELNVPVNIPLAKSWNSFQVPSFVNFSFSPSKVLGFLSAERASSLIIFQCLSSSYRYVSNEVLKRTLKKWYYLLFPITPIV